MKNLTTTKFFAIMVASLLSVSFTSASAQGNFVARVDDQAASSSASGFETSDPNASNTVTVSESVSKNFSKEFAGSTNAVWEKTTNGYVVRFTSDGSIQNWAYLTKKGKCYSSMRYYTENELPAAVRRDIKSGYTDFTITSVKEVHAYQTTVYLVSIANQSTWKVLQVVNGETNVIEEYVKG
jgi:hypothetical protein